MDATAAPRTATRRPATRLLVALLVLGLLAVPVVAGPAAPAEAAATPANVAIGYEMVPRYSDAQWLPAGRAPRGSWLPETWNPDYVHPERFAVRLDGCEDDAERRRSRNGGQTVNTYEWSWDGQVRRSGRDCRPLVTFDGQGAHRVSLRVLGPLGQVRATTTDDVVLRDYLIVTLGDSYGSGEGAPDVPLTSGPVQWQDTRCHRSVNSGSAQAARRLEDSDPHSTVTFISFACSGATIDTTWSNAGDLATMLDPYTPGPTNNGTGLLGRYTGVEPPAAGPRTVPAQVDQLAAAVGDRPVDALLVSAGGNDAGFSLVATVCVLYGSCDRKFVHGAYGRDQRLDTRFRADVARLPELYQRLEQAIEDRGVQVRQGYALEYPDVLRNHRGEVCGSAIDDVLPRPTLDNIAAATVINPTLGFLLSTIGLLTDPRMDHREARWAAANVGPAINAAVRQGAEANGWRYIDGVSDGFRTRGWCTGFRAAVNTATAATRLQGPTSPLNAIGLHQDSKGTLHPNRLGFSYYADAITPRLERDLLDAPVPTDDRYTATAGEVLDVPAPEGLLANDHARSSAPLTAALVEGGELGGVQVRPDGSFTYTPHPGRHGTDTFTYEVRAGTSIGVRARVVVEVRPPRDAPVAVPDQLTVAPGGRVTFRPVDNDTDPDGDALTFARIGRQPTLGIVRGADGRLTYTNDGQTGTDTLTYWVTDGTTDVEGTVTIVVSGEPAQQRFTVDPASLDLGAVRVGEHRELPVRVANTSDEAQVAELTDVELSGPFTVADGCAGAKLAPDATCEITVRFAPTAGGPQEGQLRARVDGQLVVVTLAGRGLAPVTGPPWTASVTGIDFGRTVVGNPGPSYVIDVANTTGRFVTFDGPAPTVPAPWRLWDECTGRNVSPGGCRITIHHDRSTTPGPVEHDLVLSWNGRTEVIPLRTQVVASEAEATGPVVQMTQGARITSLAGASGTVSLLFRHQGRGVTPLSGTATVTGSEDLRLVSGSTCLTLTQISLWNWCSVTLSYTPRVGKVEQATVDVTLNGSRFSVPVELTARGMPAG